MGNLRPTTGPQQTVSFAQAMQSMTQSDHGVWSQAKLMNNFNKP